MEIPTLITTQVTLRPWTLADVEPLFAILQEEDILSYFPRTTPPPIDRVERYIRYHLGQWQERGYGHWAVAEKASGRLMGWTGLEYLPETQETEVAYLLSHTFWGHGYATEAALAAVEYGFGPVGLAEIIGLVHPENIASRRVLEKCGLEYIDQKEYFGMQVLRFRKKCQGIG
jgi:[ribosomal protein S5]-alanine N-acetyltransferase